MAQTNENYIVTVIDNDNARDNETEKILTNKYRGKLRYFKNETNLGMVGNWNKCLEISQAEHICMLHDDDVLEPNFLDTIYRIMRSIKEFGILSLKPEDIYEDDKNLIHKKKTKKSVDFKISLLKKLGIDNYNRIKKLSYIHFLLGNVASPCAMVINVKKAKQLNGWTFEEYPSHDYSFNARMAYYHSAYHINLRNPISRYSKGESTSSHSHIKSLFKEQKNMFYKTNINYISRFRYFVYAPYLIFSKAKILNQKNSFFSSLFFLIWLLLDYKIHSKHLRWLK